MTAPALTDELLDLMDHEKVIEQGLAGFVEVGNALLAIKADRKYCHAGYDTFEDYCQRRWNIGRRYGNRLVTAAATVEALARELPELGPIGPILPTVESQVRPLTALPEPERAEAWVEAVERADGGQPTAAEVAEVVAERRTPKPVPKPGPNGGQSCGAPPHPAPFSDAVLDAFGELLDEHHDGDDRRVVDPFAGTGRIHELRPGWDTIGVELEPEWARLHPDTICGDSRCLEDLLYDRRPIAAVVTSPAYGNRLADSYDAYDPEARRSYSIDLGRPLTDGNGAGLQWGSDYRQLHERVWQECAWLLRPGGLFILNCKDHQRDGRIQAVTGWHVRALVELGLAVIDLRTLPAAGLPFTTAKPLSELVIAFRKDSA